MQDLPGAPLQGDLLRPSILDKSMMAIQELNIAADLFWANISPSQFEVQLHIMHVQASIRHACIVQHHRTACPPAATVGAWCVVREVQ